MALGSAARNPRASISRSMLAPSPSRTASGSPVVLLTVDVLGIPADVYDEVARRLEKKAGVKKDRLAITATHTHTGPMLTGANPTLFGVPIPKEHLAHIDQYTPVFIDKLEEAAFAALKDRQPAKLEWGVGKATFAMNRRTKGGPIDHDLPVLVRQGCEGQGAGGLPQLCLPLRHAVAQQDRRRLGRVRGQ